MPASRNREVEGDQLTGLRHSDSSFFLETTDCAKFCVDGYLPLDESVELRIQLIQRGDFQLYLPCRVLQRA